jgi:hypothetical protein
MKKFCAFLAIAALLFSGIPAMADPGRLIGGRYVQKCIDLPLASFLTSTGGAVPITGSTAPGFATNDGVPSIEWADAETTPAFLTFRVPEDYGADGRFKVFATESLVTTQCSLDFTVYVNRDGSAADTSGTNQTAVAMTNTTANVTEEIILIPATDFDSLQGGDWVYFEMFRDDTLAGAQAIEAKGVVFCYTPVGW